MEQSVDFSFESLVDGDVSLHIKRQGFFPRSRGKGGPAVQAAGPGRS